MWHIGATLYVMRDEKIHLAGFFTDEADVQMPTDEGSVSEMRIWPISLI